MLKKWFAIVENLVPALTSLFTENFYAIQDAAQNDALTIPSGREVPGHMKDTYSKHLLWREKSQAGEREEGEENSQNC